MTTTTHLGLTLLEQSQAQKEVTVNAALVKLDALMNTGAKSRTIATPPGSPASGDVYIVGTSPTGAWSGQAGNIAYYDQSWKFITPLEGMILWVNDEDAVYAYTGSAWQLQASNLYTSLSGASQTLDATHFNRTLIISHSSAITLTMPNSLPVGFRCRVIQSAAGKVTFTAGSGATRRNRSSHTKTAGQWAACHLEIISNSGGSAAEYVLSGDTAA